MAGEDVTQPSAPGARPLPLHLGQALGDYVIDAVVARGGFGTVYRAHHRARDHHVAIKVLHADLVTSDGLARFYREVGVLEAIAHPSLVDIEAVGELPGGVPYFVMELLGGQDLEAELAERRRFAPPAALAVLTPIADALAAAHAHGVIHRDVKASNVVLDPARARSPVVLLDFGIAKLLDTGAGLTATRQLVGSPACNAPEQIEGGVVDARTDVYGLAVLAFQLLTGELPFALDEVGQLQHLVAPRPRASTRARLIPEIDRVLARGMAIAPADRPPGPVELVAELAAVLDRQAEVEVGVLEHRELEAVVVHVLPVGDRDEALVGETAAVEAAAAAALAGHGFALVRERGGTATFVRALGAPGLDAGAIAAEVGAALRARASARIRTAAVVRRGRAELVGGVLWSGELVDDG